MKFDAHYSYTGSIKGTHYDKFRIDIVTVIPDQESSIFMGRWDEVYVAGHGLALWLSTEMKDKKLAGIVKQIREGDVAAVNDLIRKDPKNEGTFILPQGGHAKLYNRFTGLMEGGSFPFFEGELNVNSENFVELEERELGKLALLT